MKKLLFILSIVIFLLSCKEDRYDYGYVNFHIDPESSEYFNLNYGNRGWEYFEGGMRGVVLFRYSYSEFFAYERSCTAKNCRGRLEVDESNNMIIFCPECDSKYIYVDGSPVEGSKSQRPLYKYCTYYDGAKLWVYNCN